MSHVPARLSCIFSSHPGVISLLLRDLRDSDLKSCALVCKTWRNEVIALRKCRTTLQCLSLANNDSDTNIFKTLLGYRLPYFCLVFVKYSLYNRLAQVGSLKFRNSVVHRYLHVALPEKCQSALLTCIKFPEDSHDISMIIFPERIGVRIQQFYVRSNQTEINVLANIDNLKCVLAFMYSCKAKSVLQKIIIQLKSQGIKMVLGAFMLSNFILEDGKHEHDFLQLVAFSGVNIEVGSVFIPQEALTPAQVQSHMSHLEVGSESVTLMFSERQRKVDDVSVLRSRYPNSQIAGLDTEDVFMMVEDRLVSTIPSWQGVPESIRDCYTRTSGPAQVISLSYK